MPTWSANYGSWVQLRVTASQISQNISANTSLVRVSAEIYYPGSTSAFNNFDQSLVVTVDGSQIATSTFRYSVGAYGTYGLGTWDKTVVHNGDGTKSARVQVTASGGGDYASIDQTLGLTTIPRASVPTLEVNSVDIGESVKLHFNKKSSGFTHDVYFSFGNAMKLVATKATGDNVTYPTTIDLANEIPDATSGQGSFHVTTFNGVTKVGETQYITLTLKVPDNTTTAPIITAPLFDEKNAKTKALNAGYVQSRSEVDVSTNASAKWGATVARNQIYIDGITYNGSNNSNSATIRYNPSKSGTIGTYAIVTDSRGRTRTSVVSNLIVNGYSAPSLSFVAGRNPTNKEKLIVTASSSFSSLSSKNTTTMTLQYRLRSSGIWGSNIASKSSTNGTVEINTADLLTHTVLGTRAYEVRVVVTDKLSESRESIVNISTNKALFDAYKDVGIAIGKMYDPTNPIELQVNGDAEFNGSLKLIGSEQDIRFTINPIVGNASMEIGSTTAISTPYIDFHTTAGDNDYDARMIAYGGMSGSVGQAWLNFEASALRIKGTNIVAHGSNGNGYWTRFYDGTMVCWGSIPTKSVNGVTEHGITFPSTFLDTDSTYFNAIGRPSADWTNFGVQACQVLNATTGWVTIGSQVSQNFIEGKWFAIGRWK